MPESEDGAPLVRDPSSKAHHIDACLTPAVEYSKSAGFDRFDFENVALPELALDRIALTTTLVGKTLRAPLMIAPMTGGIERAAVINRRLAAAAEYRATHLRLIQTDRSLAQLRGAATC